MLAAALGGAVATEAEVRAAAVAGASWAQLGLTQNERHSTSWLTMVGTAPRGPSGAARNSAKVFDGGARGLGAVNVVGAKLSVVQASHGLQLQPPWVVRTAAAS